MFSCMHSLLGPFFDLSLHMAFSPLFIPSEGRSNSRPMLSLEPSLAIHVFLAIAYTHLQDQPKLPTNQMPSILQAPSTVNVTLGAHTHVICLKPERRLGMGHIQCPDLKMEIQRHTTTCQGPLEPKRHNFLTLETCSAPCRWTLCWRSPIENSQHPLF